MANAALQYSDSSLPGNQEHVDTFQFKYRQCAAMLLEPHVNTGPISERLYVTTGWYYGDTTRKCCSKCVGASTCLSCALPPAILVAPSAGLQPSRGLSCMHCCLLMRACVNSAPSTAQSATVLCDVLSQRALPRSVVDLSVLATRSLDIRTQEGVSGSAPCGRSSHPGIKLPIVLFQIVCKC